MLDTLITVAVLLALAFPVLAIVAIVMASNARYELRSLQGRIVTLEAARRAAVAPAPSAAAERVMPPPLADAAPAPPPPLEAGPSTPPPLPPIPPPPPPAAPKTTLEERFGTQWVVWIGGLALALGGVFLVRYAVEQDLLGPGVRIFLGALFAAGLIAAGEWTRRGEIATGLVTGLAAVPSRHIP